MLCGDALNNSLQFCIKPDQLSSGSTIMTHGQLIPLHGGNPISLRKAVLTIGRHPDCDIVIRHRSVAAQHCRLEWRGDGWFVRHLKSKNGVQVDGIPREESPVTSGCVIRIGAARFELAMGTVTKSQRGTTRSQSKVPTTGENRSQSRPASQSEPTASTAKQQTRVAVAERPLDKQRAPATGSPSIKPSSSAKPRRFLGKLTPQGGGDIIPLLDERVVIGRGRACDLRLKFSTVSTEHCCIEFQDGYWLARDLKSRNGIRVNGSQTRESWLMPGDILSVARFRFEIDYQPRSSEPPPPLDPSAGGSLLEKAGLTKALQDNPDPDWLKSDQNPEPENRIDLESL